MNRNDLLQHLNNAKPFLASNDFIPALTHFNFSDNTITAYNDISGIQISVVTELNCAIPGQLMLKILSTMSSTAVRVEKPDDKYLRLVDGRSKIKLPILDTSEFEILFTIPDTDEMQLIKLPIAFFTGLEKCLINVNEDPAHKEQNGIFWSITNNNINIYSTDDATISKFSFKSDSVKIKTPIEAITEKFFCEQLISLSKFYSEDDETIDIYFSNKQVVANIGKNTACTIYTRVMLQNSINYEDIIKPHLNTVTETHRIKIPDKLPPALDRAIVILTANKDNKNMDVAIDNSELRMLSESTVGRVVDIVELPVDLGNFNFNVDPNLVQRGLKVANKIAFTPNLIMMKDDNAFLHLISYSVAAGNEE